MNDEVITGVVRLLGIRLTGRDKHYWARQLQEFANHFGDRGYWGIEFGLQDSRGSISISWITEKQTIDKQIHFHSKDMMLGYVQGYLEMLENLWDD
jgi:hypothetical protein